MTEAALARRVAGRGIDCHVVNDVVLPGAGGTRGNIVEIQRVPDLPRDDVIGARRVATHADSTDDLPRRRVERESATEHVHAADAFSFHRISRGTVLERRTA